LKSVGSFVTILPAQISSLSGFLSVKGGPGSGTMHMPCLNQMINLVFSYAIQCDPFVEVMNHLLNRMRTLRSKQSVEILASNCPGLVRRRWAYMVEVLKFRLTHLTDEQTVFEITGKSPIPSHFGLISRLLLPLCLISHVMETRCLTLGEVISAAYEVLRKW
jgi:hypothetical protein